MGELLVYLAVMIATMLVLWATYIDLKHWAERDLPEKIDKWIEEAKERHR